jgi:YbbR domain-containing protein
MDYDRYTSFPPIQPVSRVVSSFQRVDRVDNTVETIKHTEYKGAINSEVQVQTYNKSGEKISLIR